jgi:molybdopterin-binding protein
MQLSARNQIAGTVRSITLGETTAEVVLEVADGIVIKSEITKDAVQDLGLSEGSPAIAVIKSTDVMTAIA